MGTSGVDVVRLLGSDIFSRGKPSENCEADKFTSANSSSNHFFSCGSPSLS